MDWPNIKTIIIILLVITNLMLVFIVVEDWQLFHAENESNLEDVLSLYKNNNVGVSVDMDVLNFPKYIYSIDLEFETIPTEMVQLFLGPGYIYNGEAYSLNDEIVYYKEMEFVWAKKDHEGRVLQDREQNLRWFETVGDSEMAMQVIDRFIQDRGIDLSYDSMEVRQLGDYRIVTFRKHANNRILEEHKTVVWMYSDQVVGYKVAWPVNIRSTEVTKYDIIHLDSALYSAIGSFESADVIEDISLVYKLNDQRFQVSNLISGEALPYYRFKTTKGQVVFIQAVVEP